MDRVNGSPPRPDVKYATKETLAHEMVADRELASGQVVRLRRGSLAQFIVEDGELPNHLREIAVAVESQAYARKMEQAPETVSADDVTNFEVLQWRFLAHYLDQPQVEPADVPKLFSPEDRTEMFTYIIHGDVLAGIARFRRKAELLKLEGAGNRGGAEGS